MKRDRSGTAIPVGSFVGSPVVLALSASSARTAALKPNTIYRLWSSVAFFFKWGDGTVTAALTDHPVAADAEIQHVTEGSNLFLAGIVSSGSGTLFISEIDANATS